ncbi:MAG TPA: hypothetical protein VGQ42_14600 [Candidatus Dormibacteraeota bacterium]|jgi:hypothetical protein|nr:hypothetical protein [Candidatus Dormibacteraeota bacterium]
MPAPGRTLTALLTAGGASALAALGLACTTLTAEAVSGGGYDPAQQGCSKTADRNDRPQSTEKGCHNATLQVNQGSGDYRSKWHVLSINSDQLPSGQSPHAGSVAADPGRGSRYVVAFDTGTGKLILVAPLNVALDLATWAAGGFQGAPPLPAQLLGTPGTPGATLTQHDARQRNVLDGAGNQQVYFGADDNLNNGEHDGVNPTDYGGRDRRVANGPSDGGAFQANTHVQGNAGDPLSLLAKNVDPSDMHNPLRAADAGTGACADGLCAGADTTRRRAYRGGCSSCADQSVYNDQNSTAWRSPDCSAGDTASQDKCGAGWKNGQQQGNIYQPWSERGSYYTDPGVFVYEDPDPQASPVASKAVQYPMCELYAGTQGVWVCSSSVVPSPGLATAVVAGAARGVTRAGGSGHGGQSGNGGGGSGTVAPQVTAVLPPNQAPTGTPLLAPVAHVLPPLPVLGK